MPPRLLSPYPVVWFVCPALIALGHLVSHWLLLAVPVLAFICIIRMYSEGGFPLKRMPSAILGIALTMLAIGMFIGKLKDKPEANQTAMINPRPAVGLTHVGNASLGISVHPRSRSGMIYLQRSLKNSLAVTSRQAYG